MPPGRWIASVLCPRFIWYAAASLKSVESALKELVYEYDTSVSIQKWKVAPRCGETPDDAWPEGFTKE